MIIGKKGGSLFSYGELVRVVVEEHGENSTMVYVHTKRKMATNIFAKGDYSKTIFTNMDLQLQAPSRGVTAEVVPQQDF